MGRTHLEVADEMDDVRVLAVSDPAFQHEEPSWLPCPVLTFEELVESPLIDGVLVAAPTPTHRDLVRAALQRGKHVLCEKPLTLDPEADRELGALADGCGRILQVGFWRRFAEPYLRLREVLAEGRIGRVTALRAAQWDAAPPDPSFCDPDVSGGIEVDCGVHEFDLARWLLDEEVEEVTASSPAASDALAAVGDVATVCGLARLGGGRPVTIDLTRTAGHRDSIRTEVIGERGSAVVEFVDSGWLTVREGGDRTTVDLEADDAIRDGLRGQLRAFARAVRSGRPHPDAATADDSRSALLAGRALRRARLDGRWHRVGSPAGGAPSEG